MDNTWQQQQKRVEEDVKQTTPEAASQQSKRSRPYARRASRPAGAMLPIYNSTTMIAACLDGECHAEHSSCLVLSPHHDAPDVTCIASCRTAPAAALSTPTVNSNKISVMAPNQTTQILPLSPLTCTAESIALRSMSGSTSSSSSGWLDSASAATHLQQQQQQSVLAHDTRLHEHVHASRFVSTQCTHSKPKQAVHTTVAADYGAS
jgi:hypothetical protein